MILRSYNFFAIPHVTSGSMGIRHCWYRGSVHALGKEREKEQKVAKDSGLLVIY
jgi:hypothetical protein